MDLDGLGSISLDRWSLNQFVLMLVVVPLPLKLHIVLFF